MMSSSTKTQMLNAIHAYVLKLKKLKGIRDRSDQESKKLKTQVNRKQYRDTIGIN